MKITNTQTGPRGIYALNEARTGSNSIVLAPGESAEVEMTEGELRASRATGWFDIEEPEVAPDEAEGDAEAEVKKPRRGRPRKAADPDTTEGETEAVDPETDGDAAVTLEG